MSKRPEMLSLKIRVYILGLIAIGIVLPPVVAIAYYFWLPITFPIFQTIPYGVSVGRSFFELTEASLISALPLFGYSLASSKLESILGGPPTYSQISKFLETALVVWTACWFLSLLIEKLTIGILSDIVLAFIATILSTLVGLRYVLRYAKFQPNW
jgi:hypothetical protein